MKKLFWSFAVLGFGAFVLAALLLLGTKISTSMGIFVLSFFFPLIMIGLSGAVISNFIYYSKKAFLTEKESLASAVLIVVSLAVVAFVRWHG